MKTFRSFVTPLFDPVAHQRFVVEMRAMFPLRGAPRPMVLSQALLGRFAQRSKKELDSGGGALTPTERAPRRGLQARFAKLGLGARASATARTDDAGAAPCVTADDTPDDRCAAAGRSLLAHPERRPDPVRRLAKAVHRSCGALCTPLRRCSTTRPPDGPQPSAKNVRSASEAVQKAEESVERAEAQVLELEVTCAALNCKALNLPLKTKVEDVLSLWKRINATVKERLRTTAQAIHDSVSTVEIAERKLEKAEVKLEKARAELKEAEVKLEKAKAELEKAKAELKEAQEKALAAGPTLEEVIEQLKTQPQRFEIRATPLVGRETALEAARGYIKAVHNKEDSAYCDVNDKQKLCVCATAGTPGIGKTSLLNQIAHEASKTYPAIAATFNGDRRFENTLKSKLKEHSDLNLGDAFANALLESHFGIAKTRLSFQEAIYAIRVAACHCRPKLRSSPLPLPLPLPPLVVCLDELAYLDKDNNSTPKLSVTLPKELLNMSNDSANGVIFIFSHLQYSFGNAIKTASGRSFYNNNLLPLPLVNTEAALDLICREHEGTELGRRLKRLMEAYKGPTPVPGVVAMIDWLGGHPRALFEGLPKVLNGPLADAFLKGEDHALERARDGIFEQLKLASSPKVVDRIVRKAFRVPPPPPNQLADEKEEQLFVASGLLLKIDNKRQVVSPVALLQWASSLWEEEQQHLSSLFYTDAVFAQHGCEKKMESICFRHDAALRAFNVKPGEMSKPFKLSKYYLGGTMSKKVGDLQVTMKRPMTDCHEYVERFDGSTVTLLNQGKIVISELLTEPGIEYLVPFHLHSDNTQLIVAAVQCKFVGDSNLKLQKIYKGIVKAANAIFSNKTKKASQTVAPAPIVIPVIMSTMPREKVIPEGGVKDKAIVFNLSGLEQFFHRVPALRLLIEKAAKNKTSRKKKSARVEKEVSAEPEKGGSKKQNQKKSQ